MVEKMSEHVPLKFKVTAILLAGCVFVIMLDVRIVDNFSWYDVYESYLSSNCQLPRLDENRYIPSAAVTCQRPPPIRGSCDIANQVFFSEPLPSCKHDETYDICRTKNDEDGFQVDCFAPFCKQPISIGLINTTTGILNWNHTSSVSNLEHVIRTLVTKNESQGNYGFCFLNCSLQDDTIASQLLLLPQNITSNSCEKEGTCRKDSAVNINIIWLDSTSHSHFYRSMPRTVDALRSIKKAGNLNVFSYNLMQSIAGGTYVNTVAFTTGNVFERSYVRSKEPGLGNLLKLFQDGGYHVTMIDDLCWTWSLENCACGIPTFMGVKKQSWLSKMVFGKRRTLSETWRNFTKELKARGVNDIGVSLANCEMLKANAITDPFYSKSKVSICYNGRYQTNYLMSSLELLQSQLNTANIPQFSYLDLNLGHESSGRRIQTLDGSLAKYMSFLSRQNNTLTFMFGDHGNKYGTFVQKSKESKIEMAHPVLFVLASTDLANKLDPDWMHALDTNQERLVNILDLRQTVLSLAPNVDVKSIPINAKHDNHPNGLFHPIRRERSCDSMGVPPEAGKCICQKGQLLQTVSNATGVVLLAKFALGVINNKIQEQFLSTNGDEASSGFGNCRYLIGSWIGNVQQTVSLNITVTEMDIHVPAGLEAPQSEDVFSVVVQVGSTIPTLATNIKLVHYERISTYAVYADCRDGGVDGDLCVCCSSPTQQDLHVNAPAWFGHKSTVTNIHSHLHLLEGRTPYGLVLEVSNSSPDQTFEVVIRISREINAGYSNSYPMTLKIKPGNMVFIDVFYQLNLSIQWDLKYSVDFSKVK